MQTVRIEYVGRKPSAIDNVAGSGQCWKGAGDVRSVTASQARILLKYPDQWVLAKGSNPPGQAEPIQVQGEQGTVCVPESALEKPLEKMNKEALMAAAQTLGKTLSPTLTKKEMVDQLEVWRSGVE